MVRGFINRRLVIEHRNVGQQKAVAQPALLNNKKNNNPQGDNHEQQPW